MDAVIKRLLDKAAQDPLPEAHTSSYWRLHGEAADITQLKPSGFQGFMPASGWANAWFWLERLTNRKVIRESQSYPGVWPTAMRLAADLGISLSHNVWKSAMVLSTLLDNRCGLDRVVIIGDGHGFLGTLIRRFSPSTRLYLIDLPKILVFQAILHQRAKTDALFFTPDEIEQIPDAIDTAINVASMQEMRNESIAAYFSFLRRHHTQRFYCVNRAEKILPGGEIVRFHDFPWKPEDTIYRDGVCPFYTHYLDLKPPFIHAFDGQHLHRLAHLAPDQL